MTAGPDRDMECSPEPNRCIAVIGVMVYYDYYHRLYDLRLHAVSLLDRFQRTCCVLCLLSFL